MEEAQCIDALDQLNNSSITCQLPDSTLGFITHSLCKVPEAVPYNIPQPYTVKHLDSAIEDDDCLLSCAAFFKALLHYTNLYSKDIFSRAFGSARSVKDHPYVSFTDLRIRVVELNRFERLIADVESLICLIENAKLLEKITVDTCKSYYLGIFKGIMLRGK